jgi:hypothetical protein
VRARKGLVVEIGCGRQLAAFIRNDDGSWRRDDERHDNVMIDTTRLPALLAPHGVDATVRDSFGSQRSPTGLHAIIGRTRA